MERGGDAFEEAGRAGGDALARTEARGLAARVRSPIVQFAVTGLAAMIVLGFAAILVLRHVGRNESIRDAREVTQLLGRGVVQPVLTNAVVARDPAAVARLDEVIRTRVLQGPVVRVKLWTREGRIVYSDEPRLVGTRYPLGDEEREAFETGRVAAELSDLSRPENRFERAQKKLLEVYLPVRTRGGTPLLFEAYMRYGSIAASGRKVWLAFAPALLAALLLLWLVQLPLASSLARRLRRGQREREALLFRALDASDAERRRIAADLHDGVVQDLAGTSFALAADAERLGSAAPATEVSAALREGADATRQAMRQLRSLLVEIYPPNLRNAGLAAALSDLVARAAGRGLDTSLAVDDELGLPEAVEQLLFRAAQEGLRNVVDHAAASSVAVEVHREDGRVELTVSDDGRGFTSEELAGRQRGGHVGLRLIGDRARELGGALEVESEAGRGTRLTVRAPL